MSFDRLVRQHRRRRRKSCRLSKAMTRMTIGQFWPHRRRYFHRIRRRTSHQGKWADTVVTPRVMAGHVAGDERVSAYHSPATPSGCLWSKRAT